MEKRILGKTGLEVSVIGFGGGGIGHVFGPTTDEECQKAVKVAIDMGINYFDVAPLYGDGKAENNLGRALQDGRRESVYIGTKVRLSQEDLADIEGAVRRSVTSSLQRLRTSFVDLLQIHNRLRVSQIYPPSAGKAQNELLVRDVLKNGGLLDAMKELKKEGVAKHIGFTGYGDADAVRQVCQVEEFETVQVHYNMIQQNSTGKEQPMETEWPQPVIIPLAKESKLGMIGIRPLAAGVLSDSPDRIGQPGSELARNTEKAKALRFLQKSPFRTLSEVALVFAQMNEELATIVPGVKSAAEIEEAVHTLGLPRLSKQDLDTIERLYRMQS